MIKEVLKELNGAGAVKSKANFDMRFNEGGQSDQGGA